MGGRHTEHWRLERYARVDLELGKGENGLRRHLSFGSALKAPLFASSGNGVVTWRNVVELAA